MATSTGAIPKRKPKIPKPQATDLLQIMEGRPDMQYEQLSAQQLGSTSARALMSAPGTIMLEDGLLLRPTGQSNRPNTDNLKPEATIPDSPTDHTEPTVAQEAGIGDTSGEEDYESEVDIETTLSSIDKYLIEAEREFEAQLIGDTNLHDEIPPGDVIIQTRRLFDCNSGHMIMVPETFREDQPTIVRRYINPETGHSVFVAERDNIRADNTQQAEAQQINNNTASPLVRGAAMSLPAITADQENQGNQENNADQLPHNPNDGAELGAAGGPPNRDNTDDDGDDPDSSDGNLLQNPIEGVPHIIREKADRSFVKRVILMILQNGEGDDIAPTIIRAQELMDLLFKVPHRCCKPVTTGFCVNLSTQENRALSIARTSFLLHKDEDYGDIRRWLSTLQPNLNLAIRGIAHPAALVLTDEEIARFVEQHAPEWYATATEDEKKNLAMIVDKYITNIYPLIFLPGETDSCVPLFKIIYLGDEHVPQEYKQLLKLQSKPTRFDDQGLNPLPTQVIPHMATYDVNRHKRLVQQIRLHLSTIFRITGQPLNIIAQHFRHGEFLTYLARNPNELDEQDADNNIVSYSLDTAPWGERDVYSMALQIHGENWQAEILGEYNITLAEELEIPITDWYTDSNLVYTTSFKGVQYKIRQWDPASRICDYQESVTGRLTARRLCLPIQDMRIPQLDGLHMDWQGDFNMSQYEEMPWKEWTHPIRRKGEFITRMTPSVARHSPIRALPSGQTPYDILTAYGDCSPLAFNRFTLHHGEIVYNTGQRVCRPHNKEDYQYMEPRDRFIAMGPLATIPQTAILPGCLMMLKRCGLCRWIYGATIQCLPCKHLFCRVCLGLTQLVSVDRIVCLFCWRIPDKIRGKITQTQLNNNHPTLMFQ